jgi:hypothetical protein
MTIKGRFDGKVFVPDEPVDLPKDQRVSMDVQPAPAIDGKPMTAGDLLELVRSNPEATAAWEALAAGRDSVEVARELRRRAERRGT